MKNNLIIRIILFMITLLMSNNVNSQSKGELLFTIGRNSDANIIMYSLNTKDDKLDQTNPIAIHWLKKTEKNAIKPLTWVQNNYAYGIKYITNTDSLARFRFVSIEDKTFELRKDKEGAFKVYTAYDGAEVMLDRIFVHIEGGTFLMPNVDRVEMYAFGKDKKSCVEVIKPNAL